MMRFSDGFLDEIRDRLPISEVIGRHVTFDKKKSNPAKRDFWGCCPFHGEKTPSFHCEDRKGRYYCFGCGVSGDHFRFLVELEGLSFPEAVERLADQAGVAMPVFDPREKEREEKRATLYDVMELAAGFFEQQLQGAAGAKARAYLRERQLPANIQQTFRIGYAPDSRNALKEFLASKAVKPDQMEACGLVVSGEGIPVSYDRFRDRVMFPILDARERVIAFGGRALSADVPAKYLNSPETELFHKSNVLYNFARARKAVIDKGAVIACEGYMDTIALHAAGFPHAVAPLGTALTERQMLLLWKLNAEPILCFDGDGAGLKAAYRSIDMLLPGLEPGRTARFALLPEGMDPDDLIRAEGPQAMAEVLNAALPLSQMIWNRETAEGLFDTPERRAMLESRLRQAVSQISHDAVRRHYEQDMAERLAAFFGGSGNDNRSYRGKRGFGGTRGNSPASRYRGGGQSDGMMRGRLTPSPALLGSSFFKKGPRIPLREAALLMGACNHPAIIAAFFEEFAGLQFSAKPAEQLREWLVDFHADALSRDETSDAASVRAALQDSPHGELVAQLDQQLQRNRVWQFSIEAAFEDALEGWRQAYTLHIRARALRQELQAAERALSEDESAANFERLLSIKAEIAREEGTEALIDGFGLPSGRPSRSL